MKILHVLTVLNVGGLEMWLKCFLESQIGHSTKHDVCCTGEDTGGLSPTFTEYGVKVWHRHKKLLHPGYQGQIESLIRTEGYDLVHCHNEKTAVPFIRAARNIGIASVLTLHSERILESFNPSRRNTGPLYRWVVKRNVRYGCKHATLVTGVSAAVLSGLAKITEVPSSKTAVSLLGIPAAKEFSDEKRQSFRASLLRNQEQQLICHVGNFNKAKNHRALIDIFAKIHASDPGKFRLCSIGDGPLFSEIKQYTRQREVESQVSFLGIRNDVTDIMKASDLFLFPSLFEGLPITCMEALSCKLPIVASDIPSIGEAVSDGHDAVLCPVDDIESFSNAALQLLSDDKLKNRLVDNGLKRYHERYSMELCIQRFDRMYEDLVSPASL